MFPKIMVPQNVWFIMENPIKMGWFGGGQKPPLFLETPIYKPPKCFRWNLEIMMVQVPNLLWFKGSFFSGFLRVSNYFSMRLTIQRQISAAKNGWIQKMVVLKTCFVYSGLQNPIICSITPIRYETLGYFFLIHVRNVTDRSGEPQKKPNPTFHEILDG